jgi:NAD(P)-dependent dehydrogenase (short-subunit alcohol dehydrogenase family)
MSVAIVTGASRGLGAALAAALAREGWSVIIDARGEAALIASRDDAIAGGPSGAMVVAVAGDITDPGHRRALVDQAERLGGLDLLVNNASRLGPSPQPNLTSYPPDELRAVFEANVLAPAALTREAAGLLRDSPNPRVVNVTSDASVEAYEGWGGYGASKAALDHLSAVLAVEEPALRVWAIDPGDMRTEMQQEAFPGEDISDRPPPESVVPSLMSLLKSQRPSGRYRLAEIALTGAEATR